MTLTFKRNEQGAYEGCTKTFNHDNGKHEPIFVVVQQNGAWVLTERGLTISDHATLNAAKKAAQNIEDDKPRYVTDEDAGMAHSSYAPGQMISSYITAERISGRSYVSADGSSIISETRYPDGKITTERMDYGTAANNPA